MKRLIVAVIDDLLLDAKRNLPKLQGLRDGRYDSISVLDLSGRLAKVPTPQRMARSGLTAETAFANLEQELARRLDEGGALGQEVGLVDVIVLLDQDLSDFKGLQTAFGYRAALAHVLGVDPEAEGMLELCNSMRDDLRRLSGGWVAFGLLERLLRQRLGRRLSNIVPIRSTTSQFLFLNGGAVLAAAPSKYYVWKRNSRWNAAELLSLNDVCSSIREEPFLAVQRTINPLSIPVLIRDFVHWSPERWSLLVHACIDLLEPSGSRVCRRLLEERDMMASSTRREPWHLDPDDAEGISEFSETYPLSYWLADRIARQSLFGARSVTIEICLVLGLLFGAKRSSPEKSPNLHTQNFVPAFEYLVNDLCDLSRCTVVSTLTGYPKWAEPLAHAYIGLLLVVRSVDSDAGVSVTVSDAGIQVLMPVRASQTVEENLAGLRKAVGELLAEPQARSAEQLMPGPKPSLRRAVAYCVNELKLGFSADAKAAIRLNLSFSPVTSAGALS